MSNLREKTLFITGASRGIGLAIGRRAARDGANVVIAAKTTEAHLSLPGTIYTAAAEIEAAGGKALACAVDIRDEQQIQAAVQQAVKTFGGLDILVNNASAISLTGTQQTSLKRFDLMHQINTRGTFACSQACLPYLKQAQNPLCWLRGTSVPLNRRDVPRTSRRSDRRHTRVKHVTNMRILCTVSIPLCEYMMRVNAFDCTLPLVNQQGTRDSMRCSHKPILADGYHK